MAYLKDSINNEEGRKMCKKLSIWILPLGLILISLNSFAARDVSPEQRVEKMAQALNLDAEQQVQLRTMMKAHHEKVRALRQSHKQSITGLLNAEQQQKWKQIQQRRQQQKSNKVNER